MNIPCTASAAYAIPGLKFRPRTMNPHQQADWIKRRTASFYGVDAKRLESARRDAPLVKARQIAMYLTKQQTDLSLCAIGRMYGDRDHSTVIASISRIEGFLKVSEEWRKELSDLKDKILG